MGVGMICVGVELAEAVAPDLVVAADAMKELFIGQGIEGAVEGDAVDSAWKALENLGCSEGLVALLEDAEDSKPDGGAAQTGVVQHLGEWFLGLGH